MKIPVRNFFSESIYTRKSYQILLTKTYVYQHILKITFSQKSGFQKKFEHSDLDHGAAPHLKALMYSFYLISGEVANFINGLRRSPN